MHIQPAPQCRSDQFCMAAQCRSNWFSPDNAVPSSSDPAMRIQLVPAHNADSTRSRPLNADSTGSHPTILILIFFSYQHFVYDVGRRSSNTLSINHSASAVPWITKGNVLLVIEENQKYWKPIYVLEICVYCSQKINNFTDPFSFFCAYDLFRDYR